MYCRPRYCITVIVQCTVNMQSTVKRKSANGVHNYAFDAESDDDTIIYGNHDSSTDECENMLSDEFSSDTVCDP